MSWRLNSGLRSLLGRPAPVADKADPDDATQLIPVAINVARRPTPSGSNGLWTEAVPLSGRKVLPPDPRMMKAIGLNHSFESAVADIIDNSLDAGASTILVRFIRDKDRLVGLCMVDDGKGMDEEAIDRAMTIGGRRSYDATELGHFGIGLKAASLGQARVLTVVSRAAGTPAVGRRWLIENAANGFECDTLDGAYAAQALDRYFDVPPPSGTVVMWTDVKCFPKISHGNSVDRFVDHLLTRLRHHLGLVFHRLIAAGAVEITADVEDVSNGDTGVRFSVEAIDPFGYVRSGRKDYPRSLITPWNGSAIELKCHVWPGRSNHPNFRLPGGRPDQFQGFFMYRNDRLLQHGGWNAVFHSDRDLQLARVELHIRPNQSELFSMNAEKTRVEADPQFSTLVQAATDGKHTFLNYIDDAKKTYRDSQKRKRERPKVVRPGKGFDESVRDAITEEYDFLHTEEPLSIRWVDLRGDAFFDIDKTNSVIRLNKRYRPAIIGDRDASLNDAPLVKALIYLLAEEAFRGTLLSAKAKDKIAVWQSILTAAAQAEVE